MLIPFKIFSAHPPMISERERKIEYHLDAASEYHSKAVALLYTGKYKEAAENALMAQKHLDLASKRKREAQLAAI